MRAKASGVWTDPRKYTTHTADFDHQRDRGGPHRAGGGSIRRAGLLLRDGGTAPPDREHEPHRDLDPDLRDQLLHAPAADAGQSDRPSPVHHDQHPAGVQAVHRGGEGVGVRAHAAPRAPMAELGPPREAQDHHARQAGPHRERAERPGLRFQPADLQDRAHRGHVRHDPTDPRAERGGVRVHRPRGRRAPERLRRRVRHPTEGHADGKSASCTDTPRAAGPQTPHATPGSPGSTPE